MKKFNKEFITRLGIVLSTSVFGACCGYALKTKKINNKVYSRGYSAGTKRVLKDIVKADTNDDVIIIDEVSYYREDKMSEKTKESLTEEALTKCKNDALEELKKTLSKEAIEEFKQNELEKFKRELEEEYETKEKEIRAKLEEEYEIKEEEIRAKVEKEHETNEEELKLEQTKAKCKASLTGGVICIAALATALNGSGSSYDFRKVSEALEKLYKTVDL